jgi:putative Holliday junction resolvase
MSPLLGIDYGLSRIGLAISDEEHRIAFPLGVHRTEVDGSVLAFLAALIRERRVTGLVIGLPLKTNGQEGEMAARVRSFAARLGEETGLPVILVDERYSSRQAEKTLRDQGRRPRRQGELDALSAQIVLQNYLDGLGHD